MFFSGNYNLARDDFSYCSQGFHATDIKDTRERFTEVEVYGNKDIKKKKDLRFNVGGLPWFLCKNSKDRRTSFV